MSRLFLIAALIAACLMARPATQARAFGLDDIGGFIRDKLHIGEKAKRRHRGPKRLTKAAAPEAGGKARMYPVRFQRGKRAIPLPRPRPAALARANGAYPADKPPAPAAPVETDRTGKVHVRISRLGKERDSMSAVYLQPKETGAWPPADARAARSRCQIVLAATNVEADELKPIGGPSGCGIAAPVLVRALGAVSLKPAAKLNCTMAAAAYKWVTDVVQPAARARFHKPVVEIRQLSSYACRRRGGVTKGPVRISEHAFGNALDVAVFTLADGTKISVLKDWGGLSALFDKKAAFLREVHKKACGIFSTVLGPEANRAHRNHFHFDLGRGGRYKYCH